MVLKFFFRLSGTRGSQLQQPLHSVCNGSFPMHLVVAGADVHCATRLLLFTNNYKQPRGKGIK